MDYFGINSADDLPKLKEIFDENLVSPTTISEGIPSQEDGAEVSEDVEGEISDDTTFVVTETGELLVEVSTEEATEADSSSEEDTASNEMEAAEATEEESTEDESTEEEQEDESSEEATEEEEFHEPDTEEEGDGEEGSDEAADDKENK